MSYPERIYHDVIERLRQQVQRRNALIQKWSSAMGREFDEWVTADRAADEALRQQQEVDPFGGRRGESPERLRMLDRVVDDGTVGDEPLFQPGKWNNHVYPPRKP